jgi:histidinol-phosphate phosphatase family protein
MTSADSPLKLAPNAALFLDRDGVINRRLVGEYVRRWEEFEFLPGVLQALEILNPIFHRIFIVTNQQGIGKGMMTEDDLSGIHRKMEEVILKAGGHIDRIYHCPDLADSRSDFRKPRPGMAFLAKADFPDVDMASSVMVGDSQSDIGFARNAGMQSVFITPQPIEVQKLSPEPTLVMKDLLSFALLIQEQYKTI